MAAARKTNPVDEALKLGKGPLMAAGVFSLVSNLLYLFFPIYTQQVFSRVLMSHSTATLFVLTVGVIFVFGVSAILDGLRSKVLTNYGLVFDRYMSTPMFNALFEAAVRGNPAARSQIARDLDQFRAGISGPATSLLLDVPFIPFFFFVLFVIDPALGMLCMGGGVILFILALMQDRSTRSAITRANDESNQSYAFTESALRNSEVVRALGMTSALGLQWGKHRSVALDRQAAVSDTQNFYQNLIKLIRMIIQVMVIAAGAWLILEGSVAGGMLFANMIITARALQPIERLVGSWTVVVNAYDSYGRLKRLFSAYEEPVPATALPTPKGEVRSNASASLRRRARPTAWSWPASPSNSKRRDARRRRPLGRGQVDADAHAGRRLAALPGRCSARRIGRLQLGPDLLRQARGLPAPGHRTLRRHGAREHRALPARRAR
jgi:ABC-type protease/lipase transport system fused ATPase/permease subunit